MCQQGRAEGARVGLPSHGDKHYSEQLRLCSFHSEAALCSSATVAERDTVERGKAAMFSLRFGGSFNWGLPRRPQQQRRGNRQLRSGDGVTAAGSETLAQRVGVSCCWAAQRAQECC